MTLTEFLLARIAEAEAEASPLLRRAQEHELDCRDPRLLGREIPGWYDWPKVQSTLARVLADCEAKRQIVEDATPLETASGDLREVVRLLAAVYADHPDYRKEWKP